MKVKALSKDGKHRFSKQACNSLTLLTGLGVEGDAHCGATVQHLSRIKVDPTQPNLRQVHLLHSELLLELQDNGFQVDAGSMGENILTEGIDLLGLPKNTLLEIGQNTVLQITGLRNPCAQLDNFQSGLTQAVLERRSDGSVQRKAGIMAVVVNGGSINVGDAITVRLPQKPHEPLERV